MAGFIEGESPWRYSTSQNYSHLICCFLLDHHLLANLAMRELSFAGNDFSGAGSRACKRNCSDSQYSEKTMIGTEAPIA